MLGRSRIALAGAIGAMASVGSHIGRTVRDAGASVVGLPDRLDENGVPVHERIPRTSGNAISVAQGKRNALKARNRKRNKASHKRPRP
ncbi:hypothetical protein [Paraburkholderia aromaticivorans]|uniref:hypothetical protein n=1 Tax=Paraburkholderia aromaticivorans TaxID=2026199 RepID=UPI0014562419|nr:hypothetical protein [Paraburkholderia aromaticivorans]